MTCGLFISGLCVGFINFHRDVDLSLVRHNWGKRPFKTLPANPQRTKRLRSTISLINLEYIHDYYTIFNGNEKKTTINF